jgi:antitoxin VapB
MALNIKTLEADRLARCLSKLTGESLTEAVTRSLRERLEREQARRHGEPDLPTRLNDLLQLMRPAYDTRAVTRAELEAACGDDR